MISCDIDEKGVVALGGKITLSIELSCIIGELLKRSQCRRYIIAAILTGLSAANVTEEEKELIIDILKGE